MAPKYNWLPKDDEDQDYSSEECSISGAECTKNSHQHIHSPTRWKPSLSTCKDVILIVFATLGFIGLLRPYYQTVSTPDNSVVTISTSTSTATPSATLATASTPISCSCGNSTAQALALNCKYDSLAAAWLPPHCRDDELTAEFERSGPGKNGQWTYWRDQARTQEIRLDELAMMGDDPHFRFYMTGRWHVVHCIFYWRKEHRARFNGKVVEPRSDSEGHIKHCGKVILGPEYETIAGVELNTDR
ncbi:hypothetical protein E4U55_004743 [Claviceps digitariae]|nr:hypothetical protein E4U55_004743 [Claviceps digitariae]